MYKINQWNRIKLKTIIIFIKETIASDVQGVQNVLTMSWVGKTENPVVDPLALFGTSPLLRWDLATGATSWA